MKIEISLTAKVYYKKQIEVTEEEYNELIDDIDDNGSFILIDIVDTRISSPDCIEFDIDDYDIEDKL